MNAKKLAEQVLRESRLGTLPFVRCIVSEMKAGDRFTSQAMAAVVEREGSITCHETVGRRVSAALHHLAVGECMLRHVRRGVWERV